MARRNPATATRGAKALSRAARGAPVGRAPSPVAAASQHSAEPATATEAVEPQALVITHGFDAGSDGEPYQATVRLSGRRVGAHGNRKGRDTFVHEESIDGVVPGSGMVSVTSHVYGLDAGEWTVTGDLIRPGIHGSQSRSLNRAGRFSVEPIQPATWSWRRWRILPAPAAAVPTRWAMLAPLIGAPTVIPGAWPALLLTGGVVALATQAVLFADEGISVSQGLAVSLVAIVSGVFGTKLWYAALHPTEPWNTKIRGWAVDGFLVAALVAAIAGLLVADLPIGPYFDAVAPGLFFAVAIGRVGCFFAGCCSGRPTRSRWGIWSSDRRIGTRRIPTQLIESSAGLILGVTTAVLALADLPIPGGLLFAAAFAAYIVFRQSMLRMRAERREYSWRRSRGALEA